MGTKWVNSDGLVVRFGTRPTNEDADVPAQTNTAGRVQEISFTLPDLTLLGTDATAYTAGEFVNAAKIPANATVHQVRVITKTAAASGGAADLLLGAYTIGSDGALDVVDADGFAAAGDSALANFSAVGETLTLTSSAGAALIGDATVGSSDVVVAATYATAAYTAGELEVIIEYTLA